jgi:single-strand DNA-binding protein
LIEGRLKLDQWEDKQSGQKKSKLGVVLETFQFLDSGSGRGESEGSAPPRSPSAAVPPSAPSDSEPPPDDDVPF